MAYVLLIQHGPHREQKIGRQTDRPLPNDRGVDTPKRSHKPLFYFPQDKEIRLRMTAESDVSHSHCTGDTGFSTRSV
jgi:hypothetical protein